MSHGALLTVELDLSLKIISVILHYKEEKKNIVVVGPYFRLVSFILIHSTSLIKLISYIFTTTLAIKS